MPRVKLTKSAIDDLPTRAKEVVYWDAACPGFGVKVTPTDARFLSSCTGRAAQVRGYESTPSDLTVASLFIRRGCRRKRSSLQSLRDAIWLPRSAQRGSG
jgi:hypothetical protein